ncbi:MFS transporter [Nocardia sp. NPDC004151]|uniref:MFS transporter n=1 Tax=Nocardia sp. NPDC004151 TaxID=3364304 RepID=UPI00367CBDA1
MASHASFDATEPAAQVEPPGPPRPGWTWGSARSLAALVAVVETLALSYPLAPMTEPAIASHFRTTASGWVMMAFLIVGAATAPVAGKLADLYGKRRILLSFLALSAAGALARSRGWADCWGRSPPEARRSSTACGATCPR